LLKKPNLDSIDSEVTLTSVFCVLALILPFPLDLAALIVAIITALGLISMMTAYAVRAPAPEVYQFTAFPINLIFYFTSGAVYPIEGFPDWMKSFAVVNPEAYAVHALRSLMYKGGSLPAVIGDFAYLTLFTAIMVGIATLAFKRAL
jgi:ABC-2 type transport system permease protein